MKRIVNISLLTAAIFAGASAVHAEKSTILYLVASGHSGETAVRDMGAWIDSVRPGKYQIDFSADLSPNVLDSAEALSLEQMELLNGYDLIIMPRFGVGASGGFASTDWNDVETPIILMNPFMVTEGTRWGWVPEGVATPSLPEIQALHVAAVESPFFDGIELPADHFSMTFSEEAIMQVLVPGSELNGKSIGWTDRRENDEDPEVENGDLLLYPWVHSWDGTEGAFYPGGSQTPAGPRTLFLSQNPDNIEYYQPEARQLFLNAISIAITGESDPEYQGTGTVVELH